MSRQIKDYKRIMGEDISEFSLEKIEPTFLKLVASGEHPVLLSIQYPAHGNPYGSGIHNRLQFRGVVDYVYRDVRLANSHMEGYSSDEIKNKSIIVVDTVFSPNMVVYLRKLREQGASNIFYAFRCPDKGDLISLEEMEKMFGV